MTLNVRNEITVQPNRFVITRCKRAGWK